MNSRNYIGSTCRLAMIVALSASCTAFLYAAELISSEMIVSAVDNAVVTDEAGDSTFETLVVPAMGDRLRVAKNQNAAESRTMLAFDTSALPTEGVGGATLEFFIDLLANSSAPVNLVGFASDGSLDLADADRADAPLGSYSAGDLGIGFHSVVLDIVAVRSLFESAPMRIELRLESSGGMGDTSIDKIMPLFASSPPVLRLRSVPEPATFGCVCVGLALVIEGWRG